jgi:hypothetical protein
MHGMCGCAGVYSSMGTYVVMYVHVCGCVCTHVRAIHVHTGFVCYVHVHRSHINLVGDMVDLPFSERF